MFCHILQILLLVSLMWDSTKCQLNETDTWRYRAAVYEHRPSIPLSQTGWQSIESNLNIYEDQIRLAAQKVIKYFKFLIKL